MHAYLQGRDTLLVGPNCPGVISPGEANVGIIPPEVCLPGRVGFVSRSGTLVYQIVHELTQRGIGQSTCIGMGGDPVHGIGFIESLALFEADDGTDLIDHDRRDRRRRRGAGGRLHRRARARSRSWPTSPVSRRRRASGWATPAPSSRGRRGPRPRRRRRSRPTGVRVARTPEPGGGAGPGRPGMIRAAGRGALAALAATLLGQIPPLLIDRLRRRARGGHGRADRVALHPRVQPRRDPHRRDRPGHGVRDHLRGRGRSAGRRSSCGSSSGSGRRRRPGWPVRDPVSRSGLRWLSATRCPSPSSRRPCICGCGPPGRSCPSMSTSTASCGSRSSFPS